MENMFEPLNKIENWISQCKSVFCVYLEQTSRKGKAFMWNVDENNSTRVTVSTTENLW